MQKKFGKFMLLPLALVFMSCATIYMRYFPETVSTADKAALATLSYISNTESAAQFEGGGFKTFSGIVINSINDAPYNQNHQYSLYSMNHKIYLKPGSYAIAGDILLFSSFHPTQYGKKFSMLIDVEGGKNYELLYGSLNDFSLASMNEKIRFREKVVTQSR